jgi:hypothetical protein
MRGVAIAAVLGVIAGILSAYFGALTATRHHSFAGWQVFIPARDAEATAWANPISER